MKKILVDLTFILNEQDLKKSTSVYVQRLLDSFEQNDYKRNKVVFLVRKCLFDYFHKKYQYFDSDFILFSEANCVRISFLKSICESLLWQHQVNSIDCDVVYVPFTWIYNARKINKRKVSTIHDLKPIRECNYAYSHKSHILKIFILKMFKYYFKKAIMTSDNIIAISQFVKKDIENTFKCTETVSVVYNGIPLNVLLSCPK